MFQANESNEKLLKLLSVEPAEPNDDGEMEPIPLSQAIEEASDVPQSFKATFLEILKHVEDLQDFLNPESLGQMAQERDTHRRVLGENEELLRKIEMLQS